MRTLLLVLALAAPAMGQCPGDVNGDRRVTVAELVQAVNAALGGCDEPTPTRTRTPAPTATVPRDATLADLIGTWSAASGAPRWVLHSVVDEQPPRLAGYRPNLPDVVAVHYARDLPGVPKSYRFVLISRDTLGGDTALVFAFSLANANTMSGVWARSGFYWPASGAAPNWRSTTPMTLQR